MAIDDWSRRAVMGGLASLPALRWAAAQAPQGQAPQGKAIRVGQTLSLTGPFAQTGLIHQIVSEVFVAQVNAKGGWLGRPVEYVLLDDQSKPDVARELYERLLGVEKVDLILGPYGTAAILAAMGVAQRYKKLFIQNTMGTPALATYAWHFSANVLGANPDVTNAGILMDAFAATPHPPKTAALLILKFPSTQFFAGGARKVFPQRGAKIVLDLEYDQGTRDFTAIADRVKNANADFLWMGCLGLDGNLLLEAMSKIDYRPPRHFYLFPSPSIAEAPGAENALGVTNFDDGPPYTDDPVGGAFARDFDARAKAANMPFPHVDSQAANEYAGWQILDAAIRATKSIDDAKLAAWLEHAEVKTVVGTRDFTGAHHTAERDMTELKQVQQARWVTVWPAADASPGHKLIAP
ncbi:MAG TPA: amino acid ABC transporter substrate-binding protein [Stellaceae bacterium]|nr:amino acid ABC transporter substrate-binding protein [Stellaceae bacterium]